MFARQGGRERGASNAQRAVGQQGGARSRCAVESASWRVATGSGLHGCRVQGSEQWAARRHPARQRGEGQWVAGCGAAGP